MARGSDPDRVQGKAGTKKTNPNRLVFFGIIWSAREDLNLRPPTPHDTDRNML